MKKEYRVARISGLADLQTHLNNMSEKGWKLHTLDSHTRDFEMELIYICVWEK